jgi:UDP-glucose 4-epimerase
MNKKKKIIILGGLGFIGRNLYNRISNDNYDVTVLADRVDDAQVLDEDLKKNLVQGSILDKEFMENTLRDYDVIFSLAGSSGASDSIKNPYLDLDTNLRGHLNILEACKKNNRNALLIFPSSRLVYGKPEINPVSESHPLRPESIYAIHKLTTEQYYLLYNRLYNINCIILRISNPFGPYQKFGGNHYGILNWFVHKALVDKAIEVYGDGNQKRDFMYVDDLTGLLKLAIDNKTMVGNIYNVGYGKGIALKEAAKIIAQHVPGTKISFKPWPEIDQKIETGDYISDINLLKNDTGWTPTVPLEEAIKKTIQYYDKSSH